MVREPHTGACGCAKRRCLALGSQLGRGTRAEWIASLHAQPCHVVYTEYRPTPLQHWVYPLGGDGLHLLVDAGEPFLISQRDYLRGVDCGAQQLHIVCTDNLEVRWV